MALLDVTAVLRNPAFTSAAVLIHRSATVGSTGLLSMVETSENITPVVQSGGPAEVLARLPDGARHHDAISIHHLGELIVAGPGVYADVVLYRGVRYQIFEITGGYMDHGAGFTSAVALRERADG